MDRLAYFRVDLGDVSKDAVAGVKTLQELLSDARGRAPIKLKAHAMTQKGRNAKRRSGTMVLDHSRLQDARSRSETATERTVMDARKARWKVQLIDCIGVPDGI